MRRFLLLLTLAALASASGCMTPWGDSDLAPINYPLPSSTMTRGMAPTQAGTGARY